MKVPAASLVLGLIAGFLLAVMVRPTRNSSNGEAGNSSDEETLTRAGSITRTIEFSEELTLGELEALMKQSRDKASQARLTLAIYKLNGSQIRGVMDELREKIDSGKTDQDTYNLQNQLLAVWMELSPDDTFNWIDAMPSMSRRQQLYATALSGLAQSDPNAAISLLSSVPDDLSQSQIEQRLMWSMVKADPDVAIEFYKSNDNIPENNRMNLLSNLAPYKIDAVIPELEKMGTVLGNSEWAVANIFQSWARQDLDAVMAYIESADSDILKSAAIEAAAGKLAGKDPAAAIAMIQSLSEKNEANGMKAIYTSWLDHAPEAALASLSAIEDQKLRDEIRVKLVEDLNYRNPKAAVAVITQMEKGSSRNNALRQMTWAMRQLPLDEQEELIGQLPEENQGRFLSGMAAEIVGRDPDRATSIYLEMSEKDRSGGSGAEFLGSLSKVDPDRALELANDLPNASAKNRAMRRIVESMIEDSPEKAVGYLDKLNGKQHSQAVSALANSWGERDGEAAMQWARGLSGDSRAQAILEVSARQSERDPLEAAGIFESTLASAPDGMGGRLRSSAHQIASNYAKEDGPAAAEWAVSLGKESVATSAVGSTVQVWVHKDLVAASEWTNALDDGPIRDAAVQPIVQKIQNDEPAAAIEWAASIADDSARTKSIRSTLSNWNSNDSDAARQGLENAGLDQETYEKMLKVFE
ncbi:hypothetical protein [Haloferula sp.]|uniref:hypothetical protein n=1 Tax=Haloferula sp. TaxID=2497595 RepID=UPI00329E267B